MLYWVDELFRMAWAIFKLRNADRLPLKNYNVTIHRRHIYAAQPKTSSLPDSVSAVAKEQQDCGMQTFHNAALEKLDENGLRSRQHPYLSIKI
jgi:hypothetical protein